MYHSEPRTAPVSDDRRRMRVVIAGVSTRAAAESAARAGYDVAAIDAFGDLDQEPHVRAVSVPRETGRRFSPASAARLAAGMPSEAAMYVSGFENHARAVATLARGRLLWGNTPDVLRRVRNPLTLRHSLIQHGFSAPDIRMSVPTSGGETDSAWLVKPLASGGGCRVRPWSGRVARGCYVQALVAGTPRSVVFVAARDHVVPLGVTTQLVGDRTFGASGYRYCGSLLRDTRACGGAAVRLASRAIAAAHHVTRTFGLIGVNGLDFIDRASEPVPIEVNPRWSASMELVERAHGLSVFAAHADACRWGTLPEFRYFTAARSAPVVGKAIVFARRPVTMGDTRRWLGDDSIRDVPHPGERMRPGQPVCTVFASGATEDDCYRALAVRAARVYDDLEAWARPVA